MYEQTKLNSEIARLKLTIESKKKQIDEQKIVIDKKMLECKNAYTNGTSWLNPLREDTIKTAMETIKIMEETIKIMEESLALKEKI